MTFKEEFPSLKKEGILTVDGLDVNIEIIPLASVQRCCIDKERVKEKISKAMRMIHDVRGNLKTLFLEEDVSSVVWDAHEELYDAIEYLEELGL